MFIRVLACLLFVVSTAWAQFGVEQPFLISSLPVVSGNITNFPESISGISQRWVSRELAVGATVAIWSNRVSSLHFRNDNAAARPTNSAVGVWLDYTHFLTNASWGGLNLSNHSIWFVVTPRVVPYSGSVLWCESGGFEAGFHYYPSSGNVGLGVGSYNSPFGSVVGSMNNQHDVLFTTTNGFIRVFTNGVYAPIADTASGSAVNLTRLGRATRYHEGFLSEICVWTNVLGAVNASNLHNYRTNVYGGSP